MMAMFTFGPAGPVRHRRAFTEALASTMHQVHAVFGGDVLFQIEVPAEQVVLARTPSAARAVLAGRIAALAQGAPEGAWFGLHLCLGDINHRALGKITDASPLVLLANAAARRFAHEDQDEQTQLRIRQMVEDAAGQPAGISTSCGLGRRQPDAALAGMDRIKLLL